MTFISFSFFLFLPVVYLIFLFTADRWRWLVLLVASYGFYASFKAPYLLAVLSMVTCITYACGLRIASHNDEIGRKRLLWIGIVTCIAILALLNYLHFIAANTHSIFGLSITCSKAIISIGASYFTFQAISYLADVYLEVEEPETHFGHYALYLAFFPKLLQGPIERAVDLIHQFKKPYEFDYENIRAGILMFAWGMFKKVVVADRIAVYVDSVYGDVYSYKGLPLIFATYYYAVQIYCDFSGYTDMALGSARIFNIKLTQNFNSPYLATSIADFWRRWHISFSKWILDYIFKPLQMRWRDWKTHGTALALIATFFVSGLWHGATWGFIAWGVLHGCYLACSVYCKPFRKSMYKKLKVEKSSFLQAWQIFITFHLVCASWIFFRAGSIPEALYVFKNLPNVTENLSDYRSIKQVILMGQNLDSLKSLFLSLMILLTVSILKDKFVLLNMRLSVRWTCYLLLALMLSLLSYTEQYNFIYFQF